MNLNDKRNLIYSPEILRKYFISFLFVVISMKKAKPFFLFFFGGAAAVRKTLYFIKLFCGYFGKGNFYLDNLGRHEKIKS
jgi:hypothetical protein